MASLVVKVPHWCAGLICEHQGVDRRHCLNKAVFLCELQLPEALQSTWKNPCAQRDRGNRGGAEIAAWIQASSVISLVADGLGRRR